jgi:glycosyltransferase involved in cell wall biosynthesis
MTTLSFVIPARNEARFIAQTIDSIRRLAPAGHEIVLVDNGSTDDTVAIARSLGATILHGDGSIGALRNLGATHAHGEVLVFLDADVTLTPAWQAQLERALAPLLAGEPVVTGSHVLPTDAPNLLERYWFRALASDPRSTHVGSAHLIVAAAVFARIGGFDPALTTGEDYEFCTRAKAKGCTVVNDPTLPAIHHGFPSRLVPFMRREAWHGLGDLSSWAAFAGSRVVQATLVFLALHLLLAVALAAGMRPGAWLALAALAGLLLLSSFAKYRHAGAAAVFVNALVFYFYFAGRAWGFLRFLRGERRAASPRATRQEP